MVARSVACDEERMTSHRSTRESRVNDDRILTGWRRPRTTFGRWSLGGRQHVVPRQVRYRLGGVARIGSVRLRNR